MHVQPFGITLALRPGDDVRGAQQLGVGDAGQRAAAPPVIHQAGSKNVLADPLHDQPLGLSRLGKISDTLPEFPQRRLGKADTQRIDAREYHIELAQGVEGITSFAWAGHIGGGAA